MHPMRTLLCALATIAMATASQLPQDIAAGFNAGRSGNVILRSAQLKGQSGDAVAVLMDESQYFFTAADAPATLPVAEVADVRARLLGVSTPNPQSSTAFVRNDLFRRPNANVMVTVDSVGEETLHAFDLSRLQALLDTHASVALNGQSYPQSAVSTAATLATGTVPAQHGVVGANWRGRNGAKVHAYSSPQSWSQRATTADVLSQSFDGQPLLLSVSACAQRAQAHAAHPNSAVTARNAVTVALKNGAFSPLSNSAAFSDAFAATQESLFESLHTTQLFAEATAAGVSVDVSADARRVTVKYPAKGGELKSVTFDLSSRDAATFFGELMYAERVSTVLRSQRLHAVVTDTVPDLITVSLTGVTELIEAHGRHSPQVLAALHVLDIALPQLLVQLNGVYGAQHSVSQLVLLGSHKSFVDTVDTRDLFATVKRLLPNSDAATYYPAMYVETNTPGDVCQVLSVELDKLAFDVYCPAAHVSGTEAALLAPAAFFELSAESGAGVSAGVGASANGTSTSVFRYQVVLWLSISLAIAVLYAAYALAWMSFKKDTLLYSTFNPNWEQRKRN